MDTPLTVCAYSQVHYFAAPHRSTFADTRQDSTKAQKQSHVADCGPRSIIMDSETPTVTLHTNWPHFRNLRATTPINAHKSQMQVESKTRCLRGHVIREWEDDLFNGVDRVLPTTLGLTDAPHARPLGVGLPAVLVIHVQTLVALQFTDKTQNTAHHLSSHWNNNRKRIMQSKSKRNETDELNKWWRWQW